MNQIITSSHRKQAGITSLFIVIFAALLLSVITMSFAYLMNRDLQRSSDDELSQSAYDSAMAGVEDAKRVVMLAQSGSTRAQEAIAAGDCKTVALAGVAGDEEDVETLIQSSSGVGGVGGVGSELNQAYTCVTINLDSDDYEASVDAMRSAFVPLKGVSDVHAVRVEWHATKLSQELDLSCSETDPASVVLCPAADWGLQNTVPALLRTQLITPGDEISYTTLDRPAGGTTVFLYPSRIGIDVDMGALQRYVNATADDPSGLTNQPEPAVCAPEMGHPGRYRCQATLRLSNPVPERSDISLLRLTPIYNATSFRVTLLDDTGDVVKFDGVQPVVDSTGRANDLFRRVEARLSLVSEAAYPEFAVDVDGSICKDFFVYQTGSGPASADCTP